MDPVLVVTNADAGSGERAGLERALEVLRRHTDVETAETGNPGELDGVLQRAGSRTLVAAGGDGSLHALVAALHKRHDLDGQVLGLVPLGTGNDFARGVGIPLDPAAAAAVVTTGRPRLMDLLVDELGEVVVNNVHIGTSVEASRRGAQWKQRLGTVGLGVAGYPIGAALSAVRPALLRAHVSVDGEVVADLDQRLLMVAVGNGASLGGGTEILPGADPGDGTAEVMVSFAAGPLSRVAFAGDLLRRAHLARRDVVHLHGSTVSVRGESFWVSADGEISGPERTRTWHVEHGAYALMTPASGVTPR